MQRRCQRSELSLCEETERTRYFIHFFPTYQNIFFSRLKIRSREMSLLVKANQTTGGKKGSWG